ncbi:molybdate ABC transporter substrate-binding protein [Virgibacillus sp. JSM 102003]|uniref:molybdate ABC transporter substrate-binding protein n=1 Tax=Virgibacillus sp. JSM 102003 TaxID=1562108 RepID=UPI0035BF09B8
MKYLVYILLALSLLINAGCNNQESTEEHELFISAASSLSDVLSKLGDAFESEHPNTTLTLNYGASGKLAQQIQQGAPVDLFLSADQKWMDNLSEQKMILRNTRANFTQNKLVLVSTDNANTPINNLTELSTSGLDQIALGNPESVPAGSYAKEVLTASGIWNDIKNKLVYAKDVRQVLTYVESGNTDIGFVYASDLKRSKLVTEVTKIDESLYGPINYPAAVMASSDTKEKAKAFIKFLQSDEAQSILAEYGFGS